jgi:hypothetical protein
VAEFCEYGNEPSYSTNGGQFVEYLDEYKSRPVSVSIFNKIYFLIYYPSVSVQGHMQRN